jgi:uncharacterized membrane protein YbaN (DUF454 family)
MMRAFMLVIAYAALGLAILGIFLPLLPTVPFLLLSAWAAARSSPRFEQWLLNHPRFGAAIRDWRSNRMVSRKAKWSATGAMAVSAMFIAVLVQHRLAAGLAVVSMLAVLAWLWSRPEPALDAKPQGER